MEGICNFPSAVPNIDRFPKNFISLDGFPASAGRVPSALGQAQSDTPVCNGVTRGKWITTKNLHGAFDEWNELERLECYQPGSAGCIQDVISFCMAGEEDKPRFSPFYSIISLGIL